MPPLCLYLRYTLKFLHDDPVYQQCQSLTHEVVNEKYKKTNSRIAIFK